jgi:orotidine-5'-phosphate decarboxylase
MLVERLVDFLETAVLLRSIRIASTRIGSMVRSLKNYSRQDRAADEPIDVREGLQDTLLLFGYVLKKFNLEVDLPPIPGSLRHRRDQPGLDQPHPQRLRSHGRVRHALRHLRHSAARLGLGPDPRYRPRHLRRRARQDFPIEFLDQTRRPVRARPGPGHRPGASSRNTAAGSRSPTPSPAAPSSRSFSAKPTTHRRPMKSPLIVALDLPSANAPMNSSARSAISSAPSRSARNSLSRPVRTWCAAFGNRGPVFLDLKFHDIPNTVARAVAAAVRLDVQMLTVHASGGRAMLEAAETSARETAATLNTEPPMVLGVTILTSLDSDALAGIGMTANVARQVERLALLAFQPGSGAWFVRPLEVAALRQLLPPEVQLVTPGIRDAAAPPDDQQRVPSPRVKPSPPAPPGSCRPPDLCRADPRQRGRIHPRVALKGGSRRSRELTSQPRDRLVDAAAAGVASDSGSEQGMEQAGQRPGAERFFQIRIGCASMEFPRVDRLRPRRGWS